MIPLIIGSYYLSQNPSIKNSIPFKYEVSTHKIMQDSTNTRDLDKKFVQTPRTQPGYVGKFSIFIVVLIFLFTFQNVNNKIKTTTENLPTQAGCVPGIPTDFLSKSLVFVEYCTILREIPHIWSLVLLLSKKQAC